jgi:hypothetical protein
MVFINLLSVMYAVLWISFLLVWAAHILGNRNYVWSPLGEESAACNIPEGVDPHSYRLLCVTLLGNIFGAVCLSVYLFSL